MGAVWISCGGWASIKGVGRRVTIYQVMTSPTETSEMKSNYRKINKQMKFQFLNRVLGQGQSIYEAAQQIGIHYSTAKTIIFFHKHNHKSYRSFRLEDTAPTPTAPRATYALIPDGIFEKGRIELVCNSHFMRWEPRKEVKAGNISLTYLRASKPNPAKTHPVRKNSRKSSKSWQASRMKEEQEWNSKDYELQESVSADPSDSSYVYNK